MPARPIFQLKVCYALAQRLAALAADDPKAIRRAKAEAETIAADQAKRRGANQATLAAADVTKRLTDATHDAAGEPEVLFSADSAHGRPAVSVLSANRNGATVRIHAGSGASDPEIMSMLADALKALRSKGRGRHAVKSFPGETSEAEEAGALKFPRGNFSARRTRR